MKRPTEKPTPQLPASDARALEELILRVQDVSAAVTQTGRYESEWLFDLMLEGLEKAWAAAAALACDAGAIPRLVELLDEDSNEREQPARLARAIVRICQSDGRHAGVVRELASHEDGGVHRVAIEALDPLDALDRAALEALLPRADQAAALAHERLASVGADVYWLGVFPSDPVDGLDGAEARRMLNVAQDFCALRRKPWRSKADVARLLKLLPELPPRAAHHAFGGLFLLKQPAIDARAALRAIARVPNAETAVADLVARPRHETSLALYLLDRQSLRTLPVVFRRTLAAELLRRLEAAAPTDLDEADGAASRMATLLSAVWPAQDDAEPLVKLALRLGADTTHRRIAGYRGLDGVSPTNARRPWFLPLFERALEQNFAAPYSLVAHDLMTLAHHLPRGRRDVLVNRVLDRRQPEPALLWAVEDLHAHRPERLDALYDDPLVQPLVFEGRWTPALLVRARADLVAGRLTPEQAGETFAAAAVPGDRINQLPRFDIAAYEPGPDDVDEPGFAERPSLGSTGVTAEEWTALRRLRALTPPASLRHATEFACSYPLGPWLPEDLDYFVRVLEATLDPDPPSWWQEAATVAWRKPHLRFVPLLVRAYTQADDGDELMLELALRFLRARLGLPVSALPTPAGDVAVEPEEGENDDW